MSELEIYVDNCVKNIYYLKSKIRSPPKVRQRLQNKKLCNTEKYRLFKLCISVCSFFVFKLLGFFETVFARTKLIYLLTCLLDV